MLRRKWIWSAGMEGFQTVGVKGIQTVGVKWIRSAVVEWIQTAFLKGIQIFLTVWGKVVIIPSNIRLFTKAGVDRKDARNAGEEKYLNV